MARDRERTLLELLGDAQRILDEVRRRVADLPEEHPPFDVVAACQRWVRGVGWDETFTEELVLDEFARFERRGERRLEVAERTQLLELWRSLKAERTSQAA